MKVKKIKKQMQVVNVRVKDLSFWKDNPRVHTKESVQRLADLIKLYGIRSPINVWEKNMTVYKGNHTLKAVKLLDMKTVPVILYQFRNEAQAVAYALSDNKASEYSEWDDDILSQLLNNEEYDLSAGNTGYTEKELKEARLGWESDLDVDEMKVDNSLFDIIRITCPKGKKEEIIRFLRRRYTDEDIKIKG